VCVALHSLLLSTGCLVSSQNTRGSQCTCVEYVHTYYRVMSQYVRRYHKLRHAPRVVTCPYSSREHQDQANDKLWQTEDLPEYLVALHEMAHARHTLAPASYLGTCLSGPSTAPTDAPAQQPHHNAWLSRRDVLQAQKLPRLADDLVTAAPEQPRRANTDSRAPRACKQRA
jgi:hypothetical protein